MFPPVIYAFKYNCTVLGFCSIIQICLLIMIWPISCLNSIELRYKENRENYDNNTDGFSRKKVNSGYEFSLIYIVLTIEN